MTEVTCTMSLIFLMMLTITISQEITLHDLNNNNGYITLNLDKVRLIKNYVKVLHIINITEIENTKNIIKENILTFENKINIIGTMYKTINQNFILLDTKIENMKPHNKNKRALINILGTGLKFIAGTMDSNDEIEIKNKLDNVYDANRKLTMENNKQVLINQNIAEQIKNITNHIQKQQKTIETYFNKYNLELDKRITTLEEEVELMQYMYQINNDIILLRNHVDDIEQILFSSKLGVLTRNILGAEELKLIDNIENYNEVKLAVAFYKDQIIIILLIPKLSDIDYSKVLIEPIPDKNNMSILIETKTILVDQENNIYKYPVKDNVKRNLIMFNDKCVNNIMKSKEALCSKIVTNESEFKEITPGTIIIKNVNEINLMHNCNKLNFLLKGNYFVKFKNCKISINNKTFENFEKKQYDTIILPNFVT